MEVLLEDNENELELAGMKDWEEQEIRAALDEWCSDDPVICKIAYRQFVSKSKGWRNGKRRKRRCWKEVELVKYTSGWHLAKNTPWDEIATEILPWMDDGLEAERRLMEAVLGYHKYKRK